MKLMPIIVWWLLIIIMIPFVLWIGILVWQQLRMPRTARKWLPIVRAGLLSLLIALIAIGPSVPGDRSPAGALNLDVLFIVDRTPSVGALDYDGNHMRLDGIKDDLTKLVKELPGARIALITFDSVTTLRVPFTTDSSSVLQAIQLIDQQQSQYSKGSSIDMPLDTATQLLKQDQETYPDRGRLVFYAGDGEQTSGKSIKSFAPLKPLVNGGAVLGYGTEQGGKTRTYYGPNIDGTPDYDDTPGEEYILDYSSMGPPNYEFEPAISKINEANLKKIASDIGIPYLHRTSPDSSGSQIYDASHAQVIGDTHRQVLHYVSLYWILSIGVVGLLGWWLLELSRPIQQGLSKKEQI